MRKETISASELNALLKDARKEWKQANKSLLFTLNLINNTLKEKGAPALAAYLKALGIDKMQINDLLKDNANRVCKLCRVTDAEADAILEWVALSDKTRVSMSVNGGDSCLVDYIVGKKGVVYKFVPMPSYSFVGLIDSLSHRVKLQSIPTSCECVSFDYEKEHNAMELVIIGASVKGVKVAYKECYANYISGTYKTIMAKRVARARMRKPVAKVAKVA